jgi:hypothetical protein
MPHDGFLSPVAMEPVEDFFGDDQSAEDTDEFAPGPPAERLAHDAAARQAGPSEGRVAADNERPRGWLRRLIGS